MVARSRETVGCVSIVGAPITISSDATGGKLRGGRFADAARAPAASVRARPLMSLASAQPASYITLQAIFICCLLHMEPASIGHKRGVLEDAERESFFLGSNL